MKNSILFALCAMLFMASCKKDEKLEITMKQSGSLSVSVKEANGNPIANEPVYLYSYSSYMDAKKTDANGNVNFGTLLVGNYSVVIEDVKVGSKTYNVNQNAPVTIGNTLNLSIIPEEYVGKIEVSVINREYNQNTGSYESIPVSGVKVYAIPGDLYYFNTSNFDELISLSISNGTTSSNGETVLNDIPSGKSITLVYYTDDKTNWSSYGTSISVKKFEARKVNITTSY